MPLLDRLRNSLRTRVGHKRHALNECNIFEDMEEPSTEGVQEKSLTLFKNSRLFKARASDDTSTISANCSDFSRHNHSGNNKTKEQCESSFALTSTTTNGQINNFRKLNLMEYLDPYQYETLNDVRDDVNDDVDDDGCGAENCFTDSSPENSVAHYSLNVIPPGCSTALSPRLESRSHRIQQETALSDQCLSDSQQGNDRIRLDSVGNSSAEDLENFGYPLQRVKARSSYSSSGWGMQDQINHHMGEDAEKSTPGSGNPHSEDLLATRDFATPNDLTSLFTLQEGQLPYRKQKDEPTMTTRFRNLSSENPHRRVRVCNGIFFNQFSTNLNLKDNVQDGTMKGNIADEYL
ncbi:hypothetical protein BofuT4_P099970.1 [Botrytis cinerea T4]|uniref:Uncharacterized protein n=1 Tax=Botryotinia fuckeliana (strain T4) TaxID=999810 RepID=G2YC46_BOTF4|nr:hypothetical protein BofuT4_P099970.1 [Botrytis cinerea T4]